jgi:thiamine phosphate synthase YjbQ (UPF0047 family)
MKCREYTAHSLLLREKEKEVIYLTLREKGEKVVSGSACKEGMSHIFERFTMCSVAVSSFRWKKKAREIIDR